MATPPLLGPVLCDEPSLGSSLGGSGGLDEQSGHRRWGANAASREGGTEPAALGLTSEGLIRR